LLPQSKPTIRPKVETEGGIAMQDTSFVSRAVESITTRCRAIFANERAAETQKPSAPRRLVNPRNAASGQVFKLHVSPSCELTHWLDGRLFSRQDAIPLPMPGCNRAGCSCHYEVVADRRRKERRIADDRRDALRFEAKTGRRDTGVDRRDRSAWNNARD
jgi:hypothetical protein